MESLLKINRNKRCDRLATHVFLFSAKNRIYKQNTYTYTKWSWKLSISILTHRYKKRFLRSISRKRLTIEVSLLDVLMFFVNSHAISQLIMRVHKPKVEYKLVHLYG